MLGPLDGRSSIDRRAHAWAPESVRGAAWPARCRFAQRRSLPVSNAHRMSAIGLLRPLTSRHKTCGSSPWRPRMRRHRGGQTTSVSKRTILGLLLIAIFLGHDAAMAAQARAVPLPETSTAPQSADDASRARGESPAIQGSAPEPDHPETCSILRSARMQGSDECDRVDHLLATLDGFTVSTVPRTRAETSVWEEPRWTPGTRRALFQVYRV